MPLGLGYAIRRGLIVSQRRLEYLMAAVSRPVYRQCRRCFIFFTKHLIELLRAEIRISLSAVARSIQPWNPLSTSSFVTQPSSSSSAAAHLPRSSSAPRLTGRIIDDVQRAVSGRVLSSCPSHHAVSISSGRDSR